MDLSGFFFLLNVHGPVFVHLYRVSGLYGIQKIVAQQIDRDDPFLQSIFPHQEPASSQRIDVVRKQHGFWRQILFENDHEQGRRALLSVPVVSAHVHYPGYPIPGQSRA